MINLVLFLDHLNRNFHFHMSCGFLTLMSHQKINWKDYRGGVTPLFLFPPPFYFFSYMERPGRQIRDWPSAAFVTQELQCVYDRRLLSVSALLYWRKFGRVDIRVSYTFSEQNEVSGITFTQGKDNAVRPQEIYLKMGLVSKGSLVTKMCSVTCPKDSLLHLDC